MTSKYSTISSGLGAGSKMFDASPDLNEGKEYVSSSRTEEGKVAEASGVEA